MIHAETVILDTENRIANVDVDITTDGLELAGELEAIFTELKERGIEYTAILNALKDAYSLPIIEQGGIKN